jgi:hypothetical protein
MMRLLLAAALVGAFLTGCGAEASDDAPASGRRSPSPSPTSASASPATYFVRADTAAINKVAAAAQKSGGKALDAKSQTRCNRAGTRQGYPAWRRCWHGLLDPFKASLTSLGGQLTTLSARPFPEKCRTGLTTAASQFTSLAHRIDPLTRGIDSEKRPEQVRAMRTYDSTLNAIGKDFSAPFAPLTQVCYSPEDLASINASPSASPSVSASPSP